MTTSWQPTTLVQCISVRPWLTYPGCDEPGGCHDLTLGRIYEMLGVEGSGSFIAGMRATRSTPAASILARMRSGGKRRASKWAWQSMITAGW